METDYELHYQFVVPLWFQLWMQSLREEREKQEQEVKDGS